MLINNIIYLLRPAVSYLSQSALSSETVRLCGAVTGVCLRTKRSVQ
jgi:hypothetical protein